VTPARPPATKDELLSAAARECQALHEALGGLNEALKTEVWLGVGSVKEIVAHISGWHRQLGPALELERDRSHEDFVRVAAAVPAEPFQPGKTAWKIVDLNSAHHDAAHGDQIRAWRAIRGL
jgi:hypothetical protein